MEQNTHSMTDAGQTAITNFVGADASDTDADSGTEDLDVDVHISVLENDLSFIESAKAVGVVAEPQFPHSEYRRVWDN